MSEKPRHLDMLRDVHLPKELKKAKEIFVAAGIPCETFPRGGGLAPWLKLGLPERDVYVSYQYNRVVSTEKIPGFSCATAGLGEFEYYVNLDEKEPIAEAEVSATNIPVVEADQTPEPPKIKKIRVQ